MPTQRLNDDYGLHKYYWKQYSDEAKQRLTKIGHDLKDVGMMLERVYVAYNNQHWKHRCSYCNDVIREGFIYCMPLQGSGRNDATQYPNTQNTPDNQAQ